MCCGAGGAATGYARAGFQVVGVDIALQRSYPFRFVQGDVVSVLRALYEGERLFDGQAYFELADFDAIHASPPCKAFTTARTLGPERLRLFDPHMDLVTPTREWLQTIGLPFVIENVPGAPLRKPTLLCGSMFGLRVRRHRLFESSWHVRQPPCRHERQTDVVGVYGTGGAWERPKTNGGGRKVAGAEAAEALGIDWTERQPELAQAIPPAYTEYIGNSLRRALAK